MHRFGRFPRDSNAQATEKLFKPNIQTFINLVQFCAHIVNKLMFFNIQSIIIGVPAKVKLTKTLKEKFPDIADIYVIFMGIL